MDSKYKKIYTGNLLIVQQIVNRLNDIDISPIIKDESASQRMTGFPTPEDLLQEVFVHNDEWEKALPIVELVKSENNA